MNNEDRTRIKIIRDRINYLNGKILSTGRVNHKGTYLHNELDALEWALHFIERETGESTSAPDELSYCCGADVYKVKNNLGVDRLYCDDCDRYIGTFAANRQLDRRAA